MLLQTECDLCKLCNTRKQVVVSDGKLARCDVAVIGEAPGENEDNEGVPFIGKTGMKLRYYMKEFAGIKLGRDAVVLNTVSCRPPKNRNPEQDEIDACSNWLRRNLQLIQPKFILLVGRFAAEEFLHSYAADIRGKMFSGKDILPKWLDGRYRFEALHVYHPSYLERKHSPNINLKWAEQLHHFGWLTRAART